MVTDVSLSIERSRLPVLALLAANTISLLGSALTAVALPWFVLQTTGSAGKTGLVAAFEMLPAFAAGIFGGTLVDRFGDRRVSVVADLVSGLGIGAIPLFMSTIGLAFWQLLALVFVSALLTIPGLTARRSMLPELTTRGRMELARVNAAFESIRSIATLLGPPIAGLLVAAIGPTRVLWLDAASFGASALLVATGIPRTFVRTGATATGGYIKDLVAGLRFLRGDRLLFTLAINLGFTNTFGLAFYAVLLPVYAKRQYDDPAFLGWLFAASGAGSVAGGLFHGWKGHRLSRRKVWLAAFLLSPFEVWTIAVSPPLGAAIAALFWAGFLIAQTDPLLVTIRHERIPAELRGRVFSTFSAIAMIGPPIGLPLAGYLVESLNVRLALVIVATALHVAGVVLLFVPALHEMDARDEASVEAAAATAGRTAV